MPGPARLLGDTKFPVDRIACINPTLDESVLGVSYKGCFKLSAARTFFGMSASKTPLTAGAVS